MNKISGLIIVLLALAIILTACSGTATSSVAAVPATSPIGTPAGFKLTFPTFGYGQPIPAKYAYLTGNQSPPFSWEGAPDRTQFLVLIMEDPDAPGGTYTHWIICNIDVRAGQIGESVPVFYT